MLRPVKEPCHLLLSFSFIVLILAVASLLKYNPTIISVGRVPLFSSTNFFSTSIETYSLTTSSSVGGTGVSSCFASAFLTVIFSVSNGFIFTVNIIDFSFPASKVTSIPAFNWASVYDFPSNSILPTNVAPSGIVSDIFTVPFPSPSFLAVNVYVISSNSCNGFSSVTSVPSACFPSLVFTVVIFATFVSTSSVDVFPIVAVLLTDFTTSPAVVFSFTTTSKLTETSPFAGTTTLFHVIVPFSLSKFPFSVIVPSTKDVPSGMLSFITVVPSTSVVFFAVIVYLIVSPTFASLFSRTSSLSTIVTTCVVLFAVITGVFVSGVSSPFTFAMLLIKSIESAVTTTLNDTITVSPAFILFFHTIFPSLFSAPPSEIEASSVPSGIESIVRILFVSSLPLFVIFIT